MQLKILVAVMTISAATGAAAVPGRWTVERKASLIDTSIDYHASLEADGTVAGILEDDEHPTLSVQCGRDGMFLSVHWPDFVERDRFDEPRVGVMLRLDAEKPQTQSWISTTQSVGFMGREAKAMLQRLATVKRIALRVPDRHGTQEAAFTLDGIEVIAAEVGPMHCG